VTRDTGCNYVTVIALPYAALNA